MNRERWGWVIYDWANSAFVLCVITVIGSKYFVASFESAATVAGNLKVGPALAMRVGGLTMTAEAAWSFMVAASALLVAVSSPLLGAIADARGNKARFLQVYCAMGAIATVALWFDLPWWGIGTLIFLGNVGFEGGNVFYNGFLPEIAPMEDQDFLSSAGYSAGYFGGVLVLIASLVYFVPPRGSVQNAFLLIGAWWFGFALVTFATLKDHAPRKQHLSMGKTIVYAWGEFLSTVRGISNYPQAALFLVAFLLYNDGIATIISNATPFALQNVYQDRTLTEKIALDQLIGAIIMVQLIGVPATLLIGRIASRFGEKTALYITIILYAGTIAYGQVVEVVFEFYVMAGMIGLVMGGAQAVSRSVFASLIPKGKHAEFFGFFALSSKFSAFAGPMIYGSLLLLTGDTRLALFSLLILFVAGGVVLYFVDIPKGRARAAQG